MHFQAKSTLKNNRYHTLKHLLASNVTILKQSKLLVIIFF
jgi:hypothetical protein